MVLPDLVPICREQHFRRRFIPVIVVAFISTNNRGESAGDNHRVGLLFWCSADYRYGPCPHPQFERYSVSDGPKNAGHALKNPPAHDSARSARQT